MQPAAPGSHARRELARPRVMAFTGAICATLALAGAAAPALGAQRFAAPTPTGKADCSSAVNACAITTAIESASTGDEVIVEPGSYGTAEKPLKTELGSGAEKLTVHGVDTTPGLPTAKIFTEALIGVNVMTAGSSISDLEIVDSASSSGDALRFGGARVERLVVRAGAKESFACDFQREAVVRDTLCEQSGSGLALASSSVLGSPDKIALHNVTAISPNGVGIAAETGSEAITIEASDTIARGGGADLKALGAKASIVTSRSNWSTARLESGGTVKDDGTSQTVGVQSAAQLFVEPFPGELQEAVGAQTIGAGRLEEAAGSVDVYGFPRVFDAGGPCASTDIGASQFQPASGPLIAGESAGAVTQTSATLSATANPLGGPALAHFDYGAGAGGAPPISFSSTPASCVPVASSAQSLSAALTGLTPGTTYYYRLVAGDAAATTTPTFTAKFTTAGAPAPKPTAPVIGTLRQSASAWRESARPAQISRRKHKRPPVGTAFSFALDQQAHVGFTFTSRAAGRRLGHNCVAPSRHNRHKRSCKRTLTYTMSFLGHSGANEVRFYGRVPPHQKLPSGRYTLTVVATNAAGLRSTARSLSFTIVG